MSFAREYFDSTLAKDVMTRNVFTVLASQEIEAAAQVLQENRISGVPVVSNEGIFLGVLSIKDLPGWGHKETVGRHVMSHMTAPAITVSENHGLLEVAAIFRNSRIHRVPVVDDQGTVVGIVTTLDIVDQTLCAMEADAEPVAC